ncbi:unnamed protein product, partial [Prunus brigantina]
SVVVKALQSIPWSRFEPPDARKSFVSFLRHSAVAIISRYYAHLDEKLPENFFPEISTKISKKS